MKTNLPYGSWPSKLTSSALAKGAIRLSEPTVFNNDIYWLEGRPEESGRTAIVKYHDETASTLGPADLNVRTLVHEYGGGSWLPTSNGILFHRRVRGQDVRTGLGKQFQSARRLDEISQAESLTC